MPWQSLIRVRERTYHCWRCETVVSSSAGWFYGPVPEQAELEYLIIHICPKCALPTLFRLDQNYDYVQVPPSPAGSPISGLPDEPDVAKRDEEQCTFGQARRTIPNHLLHAGEF